MTYHRTPKSAYSVYFARAGDMVKVGCSTDPERRLPQIAEWVPYKMELVAVTQGAFDLEAALHAYFADSWSHLEWFHITPKIERVIATINAGEALSIPDLPRDAGKELNKTLKKRATMRVSVAERRSAGANWRLQRELASARPGYLRQAMESYAGPQNPPPTKSALKAIARYERELSRVSA